MARSCRRNFTRGELNLPTTPPFTVFLQIPSPGGLASPVAFTAKPHLRKLGTEFSKDVRRKPFEDAKGVCESFIIIVIPKPTLETKFSLTVIIPSIDWVGPIVNLQIAGLGEGRLYRQRIVNKLFFKERLGLFNFANVLYTWDNLFNSLHPRGSRSLIAGLSFHCPPPPSRVGSRVLAYMS